MVDFVRILIEHNIAPSIQRIKILEYLSKYKTHPTADMIYRELVKQIPTLSESDCTRVTLVQPSSRRT